MPRLLVHASLEDEDGRYFNKTLAQLDQASFVRDRTGGGYDTRDEVNEKVDGDAEEHASEEAPDSPMILPTKTQHQLDIENEWELHRPTSKTSNSLDGDETDHESIDWRRAKEAGFDEDVRSTID
jgi:DNA ligase-4